MNKIITCPTCDNNTDLSISNLYRPFCSVRCKLIDLGQWINETYTITESTTPDTEQYN